MSEETIKILITGDFCPINRIEDLALKQDYTSIFNDFIDIFKGNDLNVVDLECPLTLSGNVRTKTGPHQKAHPDSVKILNYVGIKLAALANNHIMDYDSSGFSDTIELCKANGINTIGAGKNQEDASMPYVLSVKGKKISIINYSDNEFISTPDRSFQCNPIDPLNCFYDIQNTKKTNDLLIIIVHAGNEFYELPSPRTKKLYRFFIDLGADIVISHHTHAWSGFEIYNSKPIFYGLGNFIYDWPGKRNSRWNQGYVVKLKLSDKLEFEVIPLKQCNDQPGVFHLNSNEADAFQEEIIRLNKIICDDQKLEEEFRKYCNSVFPMYDAFIEPGFGRYIVALRKRGLFPKLMSRQKRLLLLNITRCESHRDVLIRMLKQYE